MSRYEFAKIVERWHGLPTGAGGELGRAIDEIGEEIAWLEARAAARRALPGGVIHGDLFVDNVLDDGGKLVLLDFEQASDGTFAYDLAVCVNAWCYGEAWMLERVRAMVAGYARVRGLGADEREGLYVEARAAAMRFTVTRITDVELDARVAASVKATKDYRRYLARLEGLRAMGEQGFGQILR